MTAVGIDLTFRFQANLDRMRTMQSEIRSRIHAGTAEAKADWRSLEPLVVELEAGDQEFSVAAHAMLCNVLQRLATLRQSLP